MCKYLPRFHLRSLAQMKTLVVIFLFFVVSTGSCEVAPDFRPYIDKCNNWYGFFDEDTGQYDVAWEPLKNESLYFPPFTYQAWEFNTSDELDTLPFMGETHAYHSLN